jgi:nucleoside-diphosphate-sugar epimerase
MNIQNKIMKKTDKILVTGASGFIGSRLLKSLWEA